MTQQRSASMLRAVDVFMRAGVAERLKALITSPTPKAARKLRNGMAHFDGFNAAYVRLFDGRIDAARVEVERLARGLGVALDCELLSENTEIDGRHVTLDEAFASFGDGYGTFAVLDPEHLAVFQGESIKSTLVLHKPPSR